MYLFLATHTTYGFSLASFDGKKWRSKVMQKKYKQSELLLPTIQRFINLSKLEGISVVTGPGSFSGLRLGIMLANTIGWVKHLPIVGLELKTEESWETWSKRALVKLKKAKPGRLVAPRYGREPNITVKRRT